MKKKAKVKELLCHLYGIKYYLIYDKNLDIATDLITKISGAKKEEIEGFDDIPSGCVYWPTNLDAIIFLRKQDKSRVSYSTIAHEVFHLVYRMHKNKKIFLCDESEEAFAYYFGWLFDKIISLYLEME